MSVSKFQIDQMIKSLNDLRFIAKHNSSNGEVGDGTVFHYREKGDIIWATYEGGSIIFGTLSGERNGDKLFFTYQHRNKAGEYLTGECHSSLTIEGDLVVLNEQWQWTCRDKSKGTSMLIEVDSSSIK